MQPIFNKYDRPLEILQEKKRQHKSTPLGSIADEIVRIFSLVNNSDFVKELVYTEGNNKPPSIICYTKDMMKDMTQFVKSDNDRILGVDRTFNLGAVFVYKNTNVIRKETVQASESAVFVRAYAYPSMRKNNPPYRLTVKAEAQKPKKRKRVVEGILPNVYCPVKQPIPSVEFTSTLVQHLASFQSDAQILKSVRNPTDITMIDSSFGPVPFGSVLSYQQRPSTIETNIINHQNMPSFPEFILPHHDNDFTTVFNQSENEVYLGLQFNHASALELERETIYQGQTKLWHKVRQHRLTSSIFKDVCGRKADFEKLAERFLNKKNIQTAAMKFGIEHESAAAKLYSDITGNNVYLCGFVMNPSVPHLGSSPDRKVYDPNTVPMYGLLEIKCPDKDSFQDCPYLKKNNDNTYKLKHVHKYYYQIIGQLALTGMQWCDFLVKCRERTITKSEFTWMRTSG
ncbi:unnamed protein product [Mytilus edulis]|uniref:YqaJ viral recombinase domain-containing protein n=1 Tax=Mytilus edulis TaxID=6550 RepID=A0A8S3QKM1_MYTED|nr:unnamed protein product [Mytilus edulis]